MAEENKGLVKRLFEIFITFFKIGLFTFGGGYAMIPLIEREIVDSKKWIEKGEITDILALSQSVPGAIAINSATFIGYKLAGRKGALAATLGVILPSFFVILIIASLFSKFGDNRIVKLVFAGIRPAVVALIGVAVYKVGKSSIVDGLGLAIALVSMLLVVALNVHAIFIIIGGAVSGLLVYWFWADKTKILVEKRTKKNDIS